MTGEQLKNSILQEAIEGKLVPQDPNDEPASKLLERIRKEKAQLAKEGKLKKAALVNSDIYRGEDGHWYEKSGKTITDISDEIPFDIPETWKWCRMQDVIEFINGKAYKREELLNEGKYKVLRVGNLFTNKKWYYSDLELSYDKYCYKGDLLYAWSASFGPKIWEGDKTIFHYHIWNVKYEERILYREFLYYFFLIDKTRIKGATTGSTMIHVSMDNMKPRFIPIPPLEEQKRIVAKIEELKPYVERFGKAQTELDNLNKRLRPLLKRSVVQEAIEGKLVPQDPNDEPASKLLERISKEKESLVKAKKIKRDNNESRIYHTPDGHYVERFYGKRRSELCIDDEIPFEIPKGWEWCRLRAIGDWGAGATPQRGESLFYKDGTIPWIKTGELNNGVINSSVEKVTQLALDKCSLRACEIGDVLIAMYGATIGKLAIAGIKLTTNQACCACTPLSEIYNWYLFYFLMASKQSLIKLGEGGAQPNISRDKIINYLFPLPPLEEQKRIVAKIEEVFALLQ